MYENSLDSATGADDWRISYGNAPPFCGATVLPTPFCLAPVYDWAENANLRKYVPDPFTSWMSLVWTPLVIAAMTTNY